MLDLDIKADDKYYIAFDYVVDNQDIRDKYRVLKSIEEKSDGSRAYWEKGLSQWSMPERKVKLDFAIFISTICWIFLTWTPDMIYNDIDIIYWFFVQKGRNERSRAMKKY